jgi:hypothetical protein
VGPAFVRALHLTELLIFEASCALSLWGVPYHGPRTSKGRICQLLDLGYVSNGHSCNTGNFLPDVQSLSFRQN